MEFSNEVNELFTALAIAQGQMENVKKDKKNPFFKSQYADLASCWEACREPLSKNGLSVIQNANFENGDVTINTILAHKSGQWLANKLTMKPSKIDPQGIGSVITYGRRYELMAIVGLAPDDDDSETAILPPDWKNKVTGLVESDKNVWAQYFQSIGWIKVGKGLKDVPIERYEELYRNIGDHQIDFKNFKRELGE